MSHITPFSKDEPLIKVDVQIEGAKSTEIFLVFAFDTGATNTIISWDAAYRLGYDPALSSKRKRIITGSSIEYNKGAFPHGDWNEGKKIRSSLP